MVVEVDSESVGAGNVWVAAVCVTVDCMFAIRKAPKVRTVYGHVSTMLTVNVTV